VKPKKGGLLQRFESSKLNKYQGVQSQTNFFFPILSFGSAKSVRSFSKHAHEELSTDKKTKEDEERQKLHNMSDKDIISLIKSGGLATHQLESKLGDFTRAVKIRRQIVSLEEDKASAVKDLPYEHYDYANIYGACCENVVGYIQIPVGVAGPLLLDGQTYTVPLATTEGALVASTTRGCKAISKSGGAFSVITNNGMTRAPLLKFPSVKRAAELKEWLEKSENFYQVASAFNSTSRFARLQSIKCNLSGRYIYLRFKSYTGDAMGMNMVSKGVEKALSILQENFPDMVPMSLSGNFCTDKKPSAINWIEGRGKSVICEAVIPDSIIKDVLKTDIKALCELNIHKNLVGSAMAGSIGGFNAHASNIVTAIYLACGQDPAQNVESSNCLTMMEAIPGSKEGTTDLHVSVSMPSIEVGTVGGGTFLPSQSACLAMLGVKGVSAERPGANAERLARVVAATVLAGELSLMSALAAGHLVKSHIAHNRKTAEKKDVGDVGHSLAGLSSNEKN